MRLHQRLLLILLLEAAPWAAFSQVRIIFDTDFGGDADDLGALVMLHTFVRQGECELLGVMSWSVEDYVIPAIDAVNRFYGSPDIPLSIRNRDIWRAEWNYTKPIADAFPHTLQNGDVPLATAQYRKILAAQKDSSIVIVTVGPLKNILDLMESGPDEYSDLTGMQLVHRKVRECVVMGGKFPSGEGEWNFFGNMPHVTRLVLENLKVPIVFSGFEVGELIRTGTKLNDIPVKTPLTVGFLHFSKNAPWMKERYRGKILDNASFDQTAVLYAVRGGLGVYWDRVEGGYCVADTMGNSSWIAGAKTNHSYLVLKERPDTLAALIESLMLAGTPVPTPTGRQ
jgi:inosine-uridine nucleoside N-ribohydrolase